MELAQRVRLNTSKGNFQNRDASILFGFAVLAIVVLLVIYFDAGSAGTAPGDLVSMAVFP